MNEMKHFLQWICKKLLNWDLVLIERKKWEQSHHNNLQYLRQYRPEKEIIVEEKLESFDRSTLVALYRELSSTKNGLLLEQKKYSDPVEIAYRDGAIIGIDVLLNKIRILINKKDEKSEF